jgi:hypothetical protein
MFLTAVPAAKELKVRALYRHSHDASAETLAAFGQFQQDAGAFVDPRPPWESARAYARRMAATNRVPEAPTLELAELHDAAEYSALGSSSERAARARALARELRSALWRRSSWSARAMALFSPRGLGSVLTALRPPAEAAASPRPA